MCEYDVILIVIYVLFKLVGISVLRFMVFSPGRAVVNVFAKLFTRQTNRKTPPCQLFIDV